MDYQYIHNVIESKGCALPVCYVNDDNENVIIESIIRKEDGVKGYKVSTCQSNDWIRENTYWEDECSEETYRR